MNTETPGRSPLRTLFELARRRPEQQTSMRAPIAFSQWKIAAAAKIIPPADFIDAQFDTDNGVPTKDALILLSTPRSGSTMLCDLLRLNNGGVTHEYFSPFQNMPVLANRWGCIKDATLDTQAYVRSLMRYRTSDTGWLGINLQGSALPYFTKMEPHFGDVRFHYVHLIREDVIAQAVSFDIAMQTKQWSSEFTAQGEAEYSFPRLLRRLTAIQNQNALIETFLKFRGVPYAKLTYEDFAADRERTLRDFPCIPPGASLEVTPRLRRQADDRSAVWRQRFTEDILNDQSIHDAELQQKTTVRGLLGIRRMRVL